MKLSLRALNVNTSHKILNLTIEARAQKPLSFQAIFGHNSPAARARKLFKPSKDVESLIVSKKEVEKFWIWVFL